MKKLISILLAVMMAIPLFACNTNDKLDENKPNEKNEVILKVYASQYVDMEPNEVVYTSEEKALRKKYPNVKIEYITKQSLGITDDKIFADKVRTETMAGKGPDIYLFTNGSMSIGDTMKMAQSGAFYDVGEMLKSDKDVNIKDFLPSALKAGEFDSKQYILPISIDTPMYLTTKNAIEQTKINLSNCKTSHGLLTEVAKYKAERPSTDTKTIFGYYFTISPHSIKLLDYKNKTVSINTAETKLFYETYKSILKSENNASTYGTGCGFEFNNGRLAIAYTPVEYLVLDSMAIINGHDEPILLPAYNNDGKIQSSLSQYGAVSSTTKNQEMAYDFLMIMAKGGQDYSERNGEFSKPNVFFTKLTPYKPRNEINLNAYKKMYDLGLAFGMDDNFKENSFPIKPFPQEYFDRFNEIYNNIEVCTIYSQGDEMVLNYIQPYLDDKATLDECLSKAQSAMEIYISE